MKCALWSSVIVFLCVQVVSGAPAESEVEEALLHLSDRELHTLADTLLKEMKTTEKRKMIKEDMLGDATKMTEALIEQERVAAETGTVNEATKKLLQFLSSNPGIKRAGLAAHTQLEAIKQYRHNWLQTRGLSKLRGLDEEEFWSDMKRDIGSSFLKENPEVVHPDARQTIHDPDTCPFPKVTCSSTNYRSIDGTCNNLEADKEAWGSSHRSLARLISPDYADGVESPRMAANGQNLGSARLISRKLFAMDDKPSSIYTLLNMVFGQLLDHDISHTPISVLATDISTLENATINCGTGGCDQNNGVDLSKKECFPIFFPSGDIYQENRNCIPFVRSQAYLNSNCDLAPRQQANTITSWLDTSMVYGSKLTTKNQLVNDSTGEMIMMENPIDASLKPLLPPIANDKMCTGLTDVIQCFHAGDVRQNEQVSLTAMHTVFARMHNHILNQLKTAYQNNAPTTPDADTLFQETRKILTGVWQHMVYNEYLRALLGKNLMEEHQIVPQKQGFFTGYDPAVRGDVVNVFATAAFRFGHSEIPDMLRFSSKLFDVYEEMHLSKLLFAPETLYHSPVPEMSAVDAILLGMISAKAETPDDMFCGQICNHLFTSTPPFGWGLDLPALNIQRARDHGIPGYAEWRRFCNLGNANSINDFGEIPFGSRRKLKDIYDNVEDVDLFAGAMLEKPAEGAQIGPTFGCLIAIQFHNLKFGDRFYYENDRPGTGFTGPQLGEIRKFTLARLLCDTLDDVDSIQKYALVRPAKDMTMKKKVDLDFLFDGDDNERRPCTDIPDMDYSIFV